LDFFSGLLLLEGGGGVALAKSSVEARLLYCKKIRFLLFLQILRQKVTNGLLIDQDQSENTGQLKKSKKKNLS